jgi:DNA-binding MarR family transcriptional regulator
MKTDDVVASMSGEATRRAELLQRLSATFRALMWQGNKQTGDFMEHIGLTLPQAVVMWTLGAYDGIATMSDLAQMTHQSGATATGIVDRLTDAGLVERVRDKGDRRVVYVQITEAGTTKLEEIEAQRQKQTEQMTEGLNDDELEQLNSLLRKLIVSLK